MSDQFIKNNPQPIYIYEKESLRFLDANQAALNLYGYSEDEFLQMDITDLYTSEDIQTLLDSSQNVFKDGEYSKPFKHRKKDGNYIHVRISRIDHKHEESEAFLSILEDVSDLYETEKKIQMYKVAFDNTNDMIFITDPNGTITYVNESVCRVLGVTSSDLINTDITLNCSEEDKVFINDSVFHSHIKETVTFTIELITSEGKLLESDFVSTPVFDSNNQLESFVLLAKPNVIPKVPEIKVEKETEEKLSPPEIKVAQRDTGETTITSSFLSGLFHEILTPMNVILGFTQELVESIDSPSPEQKEAIDIINQNRVMILSLMNTIIEFSDIQFNKSEADLSELQVTEIIEFFEKTLNEITGIRDLEFGYGRISSSLKFNVDKKKFLSLLNNLFRLISRITSQKKLYLSAYQVEDNSFNISISDAFGKSTKQVVDTLRSLIVERQDPKSFGVSKLTIEIINKLLETLNGQFVVLNENTDKLDIGFKFPINRVEKIEEPKVEEPQKVVPKQSEIQVQSQVEEVPGQINMSDEIEFVEEDFSNSNNDNESKPNPKVEEQQTIVEEIKSEPEKLVVSNQKAVTQEKSVPPQNKNGISNLRCLYIEDQVDSQILFKVQMKDLKNIQFATSFEEALPLLESNEFDFIIMDINLQGEYNGLDALKVIHQIPSLQKIPVIAVTAYVLPGDKEKFISTGFTDFISKPIFRDKLLESLKRIFVN